MEQKHSDNGTEPTSSLGQSPPSALGVTCRSSNNCSIASTIHPRAASTQPSTKRTFDWQLLPQEELDRIAYNSHKQRKARLKLNPPRCSQCPEARFTSEAMLATHLISNKHLMRVKKLVKSGINSLANPENNATNRSAGVKDVIMENARNILDGSQDKPDSIHSIPVRTLVENKPATSVKIGKSRASGEAGYREKVEEPEPSESTSMSERSKKPKKTRKRKQMKISEESPNPDNLALSGEGKLEISRERVPPNELKQAIATSKGKSQKQMERTKAWRRLERSRKREKRREIKSKANVEESSTVNTGVLSGGGLLSASPCTSLDMELKNDLKKNDFAFYSKTKKHKTTQRLCSDPDTIKHSHDYKNFVAETTMAKPLRSCNSSTSTITEVTPQLFWNCSLCGSAWKQEKAWVGHLTSSQHMRRVLGTVQQTGLEDTPFDRVDILSASDPFGWGTGASVIEEEDSEDDEAVEEEERQANRAEEIILENDNDDMDLEE